MGGGFDFFKEGGTEALIRNIQNNPQIITNDPKFDVVVKDLFERMEAGDPKLLKWDDQFKNIVGLYDQATQGNIRSDLACKEPKTSSVFGKFLLGFKAVTNMDGLVETCRNAAHTQHRGKTPEQAREEFSERVGELYEGIGESVPVPQEDSTIESDMKRERIASPDSGSDSSRSLFSAQYQLGELPGAKESELFDVAPMEDHLLEQSLRPDLETWQSRSVTIASEDGLGHDKSNSLTSGANDRLGSKATSVAMKASARPNILSKEWWTPAKGLGVAAATGSAITLLAGGIYLFNKFFRTKKRRKGDRGKRIHARSWYIENPDSARF